MAKKQSTSQAKKEMTETPEELTVVHIPLSKIVRDPRNPRKIIPEKDIEEMAETIKMHGVISPISVRIDPKKKDQHIIIYGQCRCESAKRAEQETVPCLIRNIDADTAYEWMHIENLQRHGLDPVDEAESLAVLKGRKMSIADIVAKLGKNPTWVAQRLKIAALPDDVKDLIRAEKISLRQAEEIAKLDNQDAQIEVAHWCERYKWGFEQTKKEVEGRMMALGKVLWSLSETYTMNGEDIIPCCECQSRTGSQGELFGEVSAKDDRCLNKQCYERKRSAFVQAETNRLKAEKKKVVPAFKVEAYNSPYAQSKEDILAAKAAKVKPEFVVDSTSGKVREVYKKAKTAGNAAKKVAQWDIDRKAESLAKDYLVELVDDDENRMLAVLYVAATEHDQDIRENLVLARKNRMIQDMFEKLMNDFNDFDVPELLSGLNAKAFEEFVADAKVELGVVTREEGKEDGPESED